MKNMRIMREAEAKKINGGAVIKAAIACGSVLARGTAQAVRGCVYLYLNRKQGF